MPLANGSRFGPYQVTAQLGEGGMGEVYRARDTRLGRDVALKVLHGDVAQSADRRARFEREAKAVAGLNHPNIVALFDIGEEGGIVYFVSELVEGEALRDRISRGALPVRELLDIAVQMADGLSAAHAAGITHRDLKPENVMLTRDGRVKILDFGLARQAAVASPTQDRTVTINETQPGTVLGTANYMSPEQVRGIAVDYRSDQFSFGIILYEMATGKQAFHRESAILTMSAVVTDEPPVMDADVQAKLPPPLRWTMNRCLAKEVTRRYESTRDLYEDLRAQREHLSEAYSSGALPVLPDVKAPQAVQGSGKTWKIASGVLLLGVLGLVLALVMSQRSTGLENYRFTPFAVSSEGQRTPVWSTDGKAAAYLGEVEGQNQLFVRYLNSQVPVQLTTAGVEEVCCWSQDSRRIFFMAKNPNGDKPSNAIFSIAAVGGDPQLMMAVDFVTGDISPDGNTLAALIKDKDGYRRLQISSPIGSPLKPFPSTKFASNSQINSPKLRFSPDGKKILLMHTDSVKGRWTERRWLIPYPAENGEPREVLTTLPQSSFTPAFSWAPDSRHIVLAFPAHTGDASNLWMADTASKNLRRLTSTTTNENSPSLSPDGKTILYQESRFDLDIAKVTLTDGKVIRLIATEEDEMMPYWAAKGGKFVYVTTRNGPPEIWVRNEEGVDRPVVTQADFAPAQVNFFMNPSLTPDGDRVVYTMGEIGGKALLYISSTSGGSPSRVTNSDTGVEVASGLSPDGKQAIYFEIAGNNGRLMLVKTSGQATPTLLRDDINNGLPQWSPTGEWITTSDSNGWHLISPDGKKVRDLGKIKDNYLSFSVDGKRLYGIRQEKEHEYLHYFEVAGEGPPVDKVVADIGKDYAPSSKTNPSFRISMAPDGTCAIYSIATAKSSLWLFDGF